MSSTGIHILHALFLIICACSGATENITEKRHNRCLTWHDDLKTLTVTCRVDNIFQPVNISHKMSGIHIRCLTTNQIPSCYPKEKEFSINVDSNNKTLSVQLIELKKNTSHLEGGWECSQGGSKLYTNVSFYEGIISDSWVNIRGKILHNTNSSKDILVDCGSCRSPEGNYVEFLINNITNGSMIWNDKERVCKFKTEECHPFNCNCSSSGNLYQLRIPLTDYIKDIACEMHFYDEYRQGKIKITSHIEINENEDIIYDNSIKKVIVKNKILVTTKATTTTVESNKADTIEPPQNRNETTDSNKVTGAPIIITVIGVLASVVIFVIAVVLYLTCRFKQHRAQITKKKKSEMKHKNGGEEEKIPMLPTSSDSKTLKSRHEYLCESCEGENESNHAVSYCFNCGDYICRSCQQTHENLTKFKTHVFVQLKDLPDNFATPLVCKKHKKSQFEFYCLSHKEVLCVECLKGHSTVCQWNNINDLYKGDKSVVELRYDLPNLTRKLESDNDNLNKYETLFSKDVEDAKSKISLLPEMKSADEQCILPKIKKDLLGQLDKEQQIYNDSNTQQKKKTETLLQQVKNEIRNLDFISSTVGEKLLFVYTQLAIKRIDMAKLSMPDFGRTDLIFRWTFNKPSLGIIQSNSMKTDTSGKTIDSTTLQTPSMKNEMYSSRVKQFNDHFSKLAYVDGSLALVSNKNKRIVVYNPIEETKANVDIEFHSHDIEVIPSTKRVIITCEEVDKLQEVDLESKNDNINIYDIKNSTKASLSITPAFILLGLGSERTIKVLQHDCKCVFNIETRAEVDRLCCYDDQISYLNLKSEALISIDITGKHLKESSRPKPVDILATERGHYIILQDTQEAPSMSSIDWKELPFTIEEMLVWKDVTAFCTNSDASGIFVLSYNDNKTVLHMLAVKNETKKNANTNEDNSN